jgi:PAS domain S-box-containing protein
MITRILKIIILEDNDADAEIIQRLLKKNGYNFESEVMMTREPYLRALNEFKPDLILSDNDMPQFSASEALEILQQYSLHIPFILVTGTVSEEFAAGIIKAGADDYLLKDRLTRLPAAIEAALKQKQTEKEKTEATQLLIHNEEKYRTLVEQAFDGIIIYSPGCIILDCNDSSCNYTGYLQNELKGLAITELFFKDDLIARPLSFELLNAGQPTLDHRRLKRKDGAYLEMEIATKKMPDGNLMAVGRDITERKKAEAQRALFTSIVNSSDDAIISKTLGGIITSWNKGAETLFGYTADEAVGKSIAIIIPADRINEEPAILEKIRKGEAVQHYETERMKKDGSRIFISLTASPVRDSHGIITGVSKIARDITERKAAAQKIIQSEENLKAIFDNTSEGFLLMDRHGIVKALNTKAGQYAFFSKEKEIQIGESIYNFVEEERKASFKIIMQKVINGSSVKYDRSYETENGATKWLDFSVTPVREAGEIKGVCITGRDITERKMAEKELNNNFIEKHAMAKRMSTILNTLPANIALLDAEGIIVEVNDAWRNFADDNGFIGSNHGIGDNYIAISKLSSGQDKEDGKAVARGIKAVIDNKLKEFVLEYPCHSPKIKRWFRMVVTPLHNREYTGAVVMHVDISELRRLEDERLKSKTEEQQRITRAMLQGQERERNSIGIELHDNVNQILVGTNLILRLIKDSPDKIEEFIPSCIDNIKNAIAENRKIAHELVTPKMDTESFVELISRLIQTMLAVTGIEAIFIHENFREELLSDEQKLAAYRVAQEQCTNIVKYAKATNVVITLAIADGHFNMVIADNGIGMDSSSKPQGIGLKNIIGRINVLNGDVSIISAPGEGFRLEITMPLNTTTDTSISSDVSEIKY